MLCVFRRAKNTGHWLKQVTTCLIPLDAAYFSYPWKPEHFAPVAVLTQNLHHKSKNVATYYYANGCSIATQYKKLQANFGITSAFLIKSLRDLISRPYGQILLVQNLGLATAILALCVAFLAVNRTVVPGLERNFALFLAIRTDRFVHFPRPSVISASRIHVITSFWLPILKYRVNELSG
jgi:hypothetical protein